MEKKEILRSLKAQLDVLCMQARELIKEIKAHGSSLKDKQVRQIVESYNDIKSTLSRIGLYELSSILPHVYIGTNVVSISIDDAIAYLQKVEIGCKGGSEAIGNLLVSRELPEYLANKLEDLKEKIDKLEISDPDIIRNLNEAIKEIEHGHYLASGLISARIIDFIINQFEGKSIDEKVENIVKMKLIDRNRKDEIKNLKYAAKLARNYVSHNIRRYPDISDAIVLLGNSITLVKIYEEYKRKKIKYMTK